MHYYKFNIADWNLGTAHLSLEEESIYFRLINHYYDTQSPISLETHSVFRRLRMATHEDTALAILGEFFELTDDGWLHVRCEEILKDYRKTAKKNKVNGAKGGRPSKGAACKETQKKPNGLPNETQNNPNQEPRTTNQEPRTTNQEPRTIIDTPSIEFDDIWPYYPKRSGNNPKPKALKAYEKRRKSFSFEVIQHGVMRYQAFCEATGKLNTEFVMQAARFFGPDECFTQAWDIPISTMAPTLTQKLNDTSWANDFEIEQ